MSEVIMKAGLRTALAVAVASVALVGCDSGGSSGGGGGGNVMNFSGGNGGDAAGAYGGDADYVQAEIYSQGGLTIKSGGAANASFQVQRVADPELGDNPLIVEDDLTIARAVVTAAMDAATGVAYTLSGNNSIFISDGDLDEGDEPAVTGLVVERGATLTLEVNREFDGAVSGLDAADIYTSQSIVIHGTVVVSDAPGAAVPTRGDLQLVSGNTFINEGELNVDGTSTAVNAGWIWVEGYYAVINNGTLNASGFSGATAGDADYIGVYSDYYAQNTGELNGQGGDATGGGGGDGAYMEIYTEYGPVYNSGDLIADGGDGTTSGGDANGIQLYQNSDSAGPVVNSGTLDSSGGDASNGSAGDGSDVYVYAYGGEVRNNADVFANGGNSTGGDGNGGDGGYLEVASYTGQLNSATQPAQDITYSGDIHLQGGNGDGTGDGGSAGYMYIYQDDSCCEDISRSAVTEFVGYREIRATGGDGFSGGGEGDGVYLYTYDSEAGDVELPGGDITVQTNIIGHGGDATGNTGTLLGGYGGYIDVYADEDQYYGALQGVSSMAIMSGTFDISGGTGLNSNSSNSNDVGYFTAWGTSGVDIRGTIIADGGDDAADDGAGTADGFGGDSDSEWVWFESETGDVRFSGSISKAGGNGEGDGGEGGDVGMWGVNVYRSGPIDVSGGDADADIAGSFGGDGGWVELRAGTGLGSSSGAVNFAGGLGDTDGDEGGFWNLVSCTGLDC